MTDAKSVRVGIDAGGTKVATGLVGLEGELLASNRLDWNEIPHRLDLTAEELTGHMVERLATLLDKHQIDPLRIHSVGLGFPGDFERPNGRLKTVPNLPMFVGTEPVALYRDAFERRLGAAPPIHAENDTVVAVLAEARFGAGRGAGRLLYITVSTGVGGALFDGERATNIEPGLSIFPDPERPRLSLEDLAGGANLEQRARRLLAAFLEEGEEALAQKSRLFNLVKVPGSSCAEKLEHLKTEDLGRAAAAGDAFCRGLFEEAAGWVAAALAHILAKGWGVERIVMGGSIAEKVPGFFERVRAVLEMHQQQIDAPPGLTTFDLRTGLVPAGLGGQRGILGAVLLAREGTAGQPRQHAVRTITAAQARPIRQIVLRPHQGPDACVYEGDDDPESVHFGAVSEGNLVGIASIYRQTEDGHRDPVIWRLRGMATLEAVRGQGYGGALLEACMRHARREGGMRLWCNARTTVAGFYGGFGFRAKGEAFDLPGLGPHVVLEFEL